MPKQTFYNLQPEKQERIIHASKREFIKTSFYEASINQIIKDADISRGSFYQYFEDKEDLFVYLLEDCFMDLLSEISKQAVNKSLDIFEMYILVFDTLTSGILSEENQAFITNTISQISIKLIKDLNKTILICKDEGDIRFGIFENIVTYDNLKSTDREFIQNLYQLLGITIMSQLVSCFANICTVKESRDNFINLLETIKHGVLK